MTPSTRTRFFRASGRGLSGWASVAPSNPSDSCLKLPTRPFFISYWKLIKSKKVILAPGYLPSQVWYLWHLSGINWLIVIPAQAGNQETGKSDFLRNHQNRPWRIIIGPNFQTLSVGAPPAGGLHQSRNSLCEMRTLHGWWLDRAESIILHHR